ncbi:MAG: glutathione S-transferase [Bdellovibrionaceae bacterium]|nr:glutathione S-transferase [Pseudobdellovibrionaceae bacterium]
MIIVHHLDHSRSNRVLWLLEELGLPYEIKVYKRNPQTMLAPPELKQVHPLGKSPVLEDGETKVAESGAIITYLLEKYGNGRLQPARDTQDWRNFQYFLHYAEGSLMPVLLLGLVFSRISKPPVPFFIRPIARLIEIGIQKKLIGPQYKSNAEFLEKHLAAQPWFAGQEITAADIQMSYPIEAGASRNVFKDKPHILKWLETVRSRPAYQRAIARGGPVAFD